MEAVTDQPSLISVEGAAVIIGVSVSSIGNYLSAGKMPSRYVDGQQMIAESDCFIVKQLREQYGNQKWSRNLPPEWEYLKQQNEEQDSTEEGPDIYEKLCVQAKKLDEAGESKTALAILWTVLETGFGYNLKPDVQSI